MILVKILVHIQYSNCDDMFFNFLLLDDTLVYQGTAPHTVNDTFVNGNSLKAKCLGDNYEEKTNSFNITEDGQGATQDYTSNLRQYTDVTVSFESKAGSSLDRVVVTSSDLDASPQDLNYDTSIMVDDKLFVDEVFTFSITREGYVSQNDVQVTVLTPPSRTTETIIVIVSLISLLLILTRLLWGQFSPSLCL